MVALIALLLGSGYIQSGVSGTFPRSMWHVFINISTFQRVISSHFWERTLSMCPISGHESAPPLSPLARGQTQPLEPNKGEVYHRQNETNLTAL